MAKRREAHDEELPFVALMDTMTNVVGVLIIVLVMIGISLASSVKKVFSELPPVTVEQLKEAMQKLTEITPKEDPQKVAEELKALEQKIKRDEDALRSMDVTSDSQNIKVMDLDELNKQLQERKMERESQKTEVEKQLAEIDRLKALLDQTPVYVPPPATVVKLPNPRPMPENAVLQRFLVVGDRVAYLNDSEFLRAVTENIEKQKKALVFPNPVKNAFGEVIMDGGKPKVFLDQKKVQAFFMDRLRMSTKDIKTELIGSPSSSRMQLRLSIQEGGGETLAQINDPASVFQRAMRKFASGKDSVVWFIVNKDAIGTYLAARDIADREKAVCGWELTANPYFQRQITGFEVDHVPAKPQPPPPPNAVRIPQPKMTLD